MADDRTLMQQMMSGALTGLPSTVQVPPEVWGTNADNYNWRALEDLVDQHTAAQKLKEGDTFHIPYPDFLGGQKLYKYLGPDSGGRKDWMEIAPRHTDLTS